MKRLIKFIINQIQACAGCHGTGLRELPSGDTKACTACNGRGMI